MVKMHYWSNHERVLDRSASLQALSIQSPLELPPAREPDAIGTGVAALGTDAQARRG